MSEKENRVSFEGTGGELFKIIIVNALLSMCTLGIYYFWGIVRVRKFLYQHTTVADGRFDYHVTGKEKFIAFIKAILVMGVFGAVLYGILMVLLSGLPQELMFAVSILILYLILFLVSPVLIVAMRKFNMSRTSWNNVRMRFTGRVKELYKIVLKILFLNIVTLGFYTPWGIAAFQRFIVDNTWVGNRKFEYSGEGRAILFPHLVMLGATVLLFAGMFIPMFMAMAAIKEGGDPSAMGGAGVLTMIPFFLFFGATLWANVWMFRYLWSNTSLGENQLSCDIAFLPFLGKTLLAGLITVFTLGFGFPWAVVMLNRYTFGSIAIHGDIDPASFTGEPDSSKTSAFAEAVGEAGDFLDAIADFIA